jgi:hypothetical protein
MGTVKIMYALQDKAFRDASLFTLIIISEHCFCIIVLNGLLAKLINFHFVGDKYN